MTHPLYIFTKTITFNAVFRLIWISCSDGNLVLQSKYVALVTIICLLFIIIIIIIIKSISKVPIEQIRHKALVLLVLQSSALRRKYYTHVSLRRSSVRSPATAIHKPPSTDCSMCPLQHLQLSFLRFCWSYSLEFTA